MHFRITVRGHLRSIHISTTDGLGERRTLGWCWIQKNAADWKSVSVVQFHPWPPFKSAT